MNFINDEITIDFQVPKSIRYLIEDCEKADKDNNLGIYVNMAMSLDDTAKAAYAEGILAEEQWDRLVMRYPQ